MRIAKPPVGAALALFVTLAVAQDTAQIRHDKLGKRVLLTAPAAELRKFAVKYAEDEEAFSVELKATRRK
jgi:hypothetical protein